MHCSQSLFTSNLYPQNCQDFVVIHLQNGVKLSFQYSIIFLHRLAQIRERGIQGRIGQQFTLLKEPEEKPSIIDVSMEIGRAHV